MTGLLKMKMFVSLIVLYVLLDNGLGAPASGPGKGRYMWIKCRPNGQNANCIKQRGPLQDLPGLPDRLPASAVKDLLNKNPALDEQEATGLEWKDQQEEDQKVEEAVQEEQEEEVEEAVQEEQEEEVEEAVQEEQEEEAKEEGQEDVYEDELEEDVDEEEYQYEVDPVLVEPVEEQSGEGSAAGPFLNDQGSGELDYSSFVFPEKVMIDQVIPPVQEMKEDLLLL
ncbi:serglycin [Hypomesus transpacificus]|uniref:serglycin n=1 Tax=Hypomesus transpacificus TaxID=137520 RepID=UPI001F079EDF|nr:serglycin [Hypomesus transpacificus]